MKIKHILLLPLLLISTFSLAEATNALYNTWVLEKINHEGTDIVYSESGKQYIVIINADSIYYAGSCTPSLVTGFSVSGSKITYSTAPVIEKGCCFFDNPQETLMHKPNFEGTYSINGNKLTITNGTTVYHFTVQN